MADTQIHPTGTVAVPADYIIQQSAELLLKNAYAHFDGSGAGGSFQPLVRIISDAGSTVVEAVSDTTIAAGASCDASWFPHLAAAPAATPASSVGLPVCAIYGNPSGVSVAGDGLQHYVSLQDGVNAAGFSSSDSTVFTNGSTTLFTGSAVFGVQINAAGTYAVLNNAFTKSGGTATRGVTTYWSASNGSAPSFLQQGRSSGTTADTWDRGQAGLGPHNFTTEWMTVSSGQTPAVLCVYGQAPGGTAAVLEFSMSVVQLTTNVLTKL